MNQYGNLYSKYYDLLYNEKDYAAEVEYVLSLIKKEWSSKKNKVKDRILFDNYLIKIDGKMQKR